MQEPVCIWTICGLFILAAQLIGSVTARAADWDSRHLDPPTPRLGCIPPESPQAGQGTHGRTAGWAGYPWEARKLALRLYLHFLTSCWGTCLTNGHQGVLAEVCPCSIGVTEPPRSLGCLFCPSTVDLGVAVMCSVPDMAMA